MEKTIYNGIAEDKRSKKEKAKDFNAKELLVSGSFDTFRKVNSLSEVKRGAVRNQDGSNSCVPQAYAKAVEMSIRDILNIPFNAILTPQEIEIIMTATYAYQNRSNREYGGGSDPAEICYFGKKNKIYLERDVPSQNMNDTQIDNYKISSSLPKVGNYDFAFFLDATPEFDEIATYVAQYKNTMLLIDSDYLGYAKDYPTPNKRNHQIRHEICVVDSINYNGVDYLVIDDSWGITGNSELAQRGQRLISKEAFYGMVEQAYVIVVSKVAEKAGVDYSKYASLPKLNFGDRSNDVLKLQAMLKESGYMPENLDTINYDSKGNSYGYYGKSTAYYVLKWQLDNIKTSSQAQLSAWGGKYFGQASLLAIKNLSNAGGSNIEPTAEENMIINNTPIRFNWSKYLQVVGSIVVGFLLTIDINNVSFTKAGIFAIGTGFIHFAWQALQKKYNVSKG